MHAPRHTPPQHTLCAALDECCVRFHLVVGGVRARRTHVHLVTCTAMCEVQLVCALPFHCATTSSNLVCVTLGRTFNSLQALENDQPVDSEQLLTYWVIFALFNTIEVLSEWILYWVPFYHAFKVGRIWA